MIPVLHQKRAAVRLKFGKELHHFLGFSVVSEKHFQIAVIDGIGVLRDSGIDELFQFPFEAKAVEVLLHIVRDLPGTKPRTEIHALRLLPRFFCGIETQTLAALVQKAQRRGFQSAGRGIAVPVRLKGTAFLSEAFPIDLLHGFQRRICHDVLLLSAGNAYPLADRISV